MECGTYDWGCSHGDRPGMRCAVSEPALDAFMQSGVVGSQNAAAKHDDRRVVKQAEATQGRRGTVAVATAGCT